MQTYEILKNIREKNNLTQDQMAERIGVTRQAVSRWETGETQPNTKCSRCSRRNSMFPSIRCSALHVSSFASVAACPSVTTR